MARMSPLVSVVLSLVSDDGTTETLIRSFAEHLHSLGGAPLMSILACSNVHENKVLLRAGHSRAEVAKLAGVSVRSVKRVAKEGDIEQVDDAAERARRGIGRPSLVEDSRKPIVELLEQESDLKSVEVLRRMRLAGYTGQKTALFALIAAVRPKDRTPRCALKACLGNSASTTSGRWMSSPSTGRSGGFASSPRD